jgi:acyl-CoA reductase-like NAD-dependent aldehyde dehydrogenase
LAKPKAIPDLTAEVPYAEAAARIVSVRGERRDRDVAIAALHGFNDQMAAPDRRGVASLIGQFRAEQEHANEELAPLVAEESLQALRESIGELVAGAREVSA